MNYNKTQKFISYLLISLLLFGITFQFPGVQFGVSADSNDVYDLVSIIVDEETYRNTESEIKRYGKDISNVLENTKVVILPVPENTSPFKIASMNEALYFDGYKALANTSFESKLVGTVFVGKIAMPVVYRNNEISRTILPYTDFIDKSFIYNVESGQYEYNSQNSSGIKAEVWHGVISPNTGDSNEDIQAIKDYFSKNHDFYTGRGLYAITGDSINGNKEEGLPEDYEPYVFYYDSLRESQAVNYAEYLGYKEGYVANKEDIVYNRYTKELANKLKDEILGYSTNEIYELMNKVDPTFELPSDDSLVLDESPDIQTRYVINASVKKFIEIFSSGTIGELRENVYNAGRYNFGQNVNVDIIPYLVSVLDIANDEILKDLNNDFEKYIDNAVKDGLSRNIALPISYTYDVGGTSLRYDNYLYGNNGNQVTDPMQCSIYRGTTENGGQLVEANRGLNVYNIEGDLKIVEGMGTSCLQNVMNGRALEGLWGKNSPINFDEQQANIGEIKFKYANDLKGSIVGLYDIQGAKLNTDSSKILSPLACYQNNYILAERIECVSSGGDGSCSPQTTYRLPNTNGGGGVAWNCMTDSNGNTYNFSTSFDENYVNLSVGGCEIKSIVLDGNPIKELVGPCDVVGPEGECACIWETSVWEYKSIPSYVTHKSPTTSDLTAQIASGVSPNLPVDKDRYVDFITYDGKYAKINYPYLFRVQVEDKSKIDFDLISVELDKYLDEKSSEVNSVVNNATSVQGLLDNSELRGYLFHGNSGINVDLKSYIKSRGNNDINMSGVNKELDYYDILLFSIFWNNLDSVSAKYKFVFENYLSSQTTNDSKFYLPKNKDQYEIAYLGAYGDTQNMFVGVDPENKGENPYADIIASNQDLSTKLLGINVASNRYNSGNNNSENKCSSPEGVPIWEWLPAVMCRLEEMMPPTITIGDGNCGESFLELFSEEELEEYFNTNGDYDSNGINDYLENGLREARLLLETDSEKYYYNSVIPLKASLKAPAGNNMSFINSTDIGFELIRVEKAIDENNPLEGNNFEVVYDINNPNNNITDLSEYLNFTENTIRTIGGVSNYSFVVKGSDLNVYLRAYVKVNNRDGDEVIYLQSTNLKVEVRGERMFLSTYKFEQGEEGLELVMGASNIVADENVSTFIVDTYNSNIDSVKNLINNSTIAEEKLVFNASNIKKDGSFMPLRYPLKVDLYSGEEIIESKTINNINGFEQLFKITKSGDYKLVVTDSEGVRNTRDFTINPAMASELDLNLGTTTIQKGGNVSTNYVTILDRFDNVVSGSFNDLKLSINGSSVVFNDTNNSELTATTYEGYRIFRLKSTDNSGTSTIKASLLNEEDEEILEGEKTINVIDSYTINFLPVSDFYVGYNKYRVRVDIKDGNGNLLRDFNSRLYFYANSNYIELDAPYFDIVNGSTMIEFTTKTTAGKNIPVEIQVEGLGDIISKTITIFPDKPIKTDLVVSKSRMEADVNEYTTIQVELKDVYNNLVFNDSSTQVSLEILEQYNHIITASTAPQTMKDGKTSFRVYGTVNPGTGYIKTSVSPSLARNTFSIEDESGRIDIVGISDNAAKIETYYLWNKEKLESMKFNSVYVTLLGASYGDIEQEDYLAGAVVFNKDSKALAATSILSDPYVYNNTFALGANGGIQKLFSSGDLSQDIGISTFFDNGKLYLDIYNSSLNSHIGSIYYNPPKNVALKICESNASGCIDSTKSSIFVKSSDSKYKFYTSNSSLLLLDDTGKTFLEIDKDGNISRKANIEFELLSSTNSYVSFNLRYQDKIIGQYGMNFVDAKVNITRDAVVLNNTLGTVNNSIVTYIDSALYGYYVNGKNENQKIVVYYNDPFGSDKTLNSFSRTNMYSYEAFNDRAGLGWNDGNKTLLEFAAGESVGVSLRNNMSFASINIGDPVISLKQQRKTFNDSTQVKQFDSTIGKVISNDDKLQDFRVFDYNNDGLDDVLIIKNNGYMQLLENGSTEEEFLDLGDLAYVVDIGNLDTIKTGDFSGDGYGDIFFLGNDGNPYLLNNINKKFTKIPLFNIFNLGGTVIRSEVFDMDNDGVDDLVILDDNGELSIFYGTKGAEVPAFIKEVISAGYGIKMSSEVLSGGGLVYFDSLYQLGDDTALNKNDEVDYNLINSYLFEELTYSPEETIYEINDIEALTDAPDFMQQTTFIKSEYAERVGIKVEKTFIDRNGGNAKYEDMVDVEIKLTNVTTGTINDIAYVENVPDYISLVESSITNSKQIQPKDPGRTYDFMIDKFSLAPNETITISYFGSLKRLRYMDLKVGLYENGEDGDDLYGDIIVRDENKNCSESVDIFRSTGVKEYEKGLKSPTCSNTTLPENLSQNALDADGNGIPDYIELLSQDENARQEYADVTLDELYNDRDHDGIPDDEDSFSLNGSFNLDLGKFVQEVEAGLDKVDDFMDALSCGFNNGACFSTPLNWAPLAPGSDPTLMGYPIGDGLKINEGYPIFSSLTGLQTMCGPVPCCLPTVYPVSSLGYIPGPVCGPPSAGGYLGVWAPTNSIRIFVTPTLTGGVGTAICFGGPAIVSGMSNPPGFHPLNPGGNCIVLAKPIMGCSNDGSDGDPSSLGYPDYGMGYSDDSSINKYGIINGNCPLAQVDTSKGVIPDYVEDYYKHITGQTSGSNIGSSNGAIEDHSRGDGGPAFAVDTNYGGTEVSIKFDKDTMSFDFSDIEKIFQERIAAFPGFLMDWVTRQVEEIANKLTDFPTFFLILPSFDGIYDTDLSWEENRQRWRANNESSSNGLVTINSSDNSTLNWALGEERVNTLREGYNSFRSTVKEAYEFVATLPLVNIRQEPIDMSVPWISKTELDRAIESRTTTIKEERPEEIRRMANEWSLGQSCEITNSGALSGERPESIEECEERNAIGEKVMLEASSLLSSMNANLEAIQSYVDIPEKINQLLNKKEEYLEQILCNIESISEIMGGRIGRNGERFKSWVELYILVKAILKSWQLLIDIFFEYEEGCKECKNERQDLIGTIFELISVVIPDIPVIEFPKWPDIILDLHNIRAGLNVDLPEFSITPRPILLPELPSLYLPSTPNASLSLPDIPVLPEFVIPELPDIPSLPSVDLPDLPPAPSLPELLASLEIITDIAKLVVKAMCILKKSPFIPEWRAGDQIAFLTERNGYLPTDFINVTLPQFSLPFVDAIKVTSYVNLEFDTQFITEMAGQIATPVNQFNSDFSNLFDIKIQDLDFGIPINDINVDIDREGDVNSDIQPYGYIEDFARGITAYLQDKVTYIEENKNNLVDANTFKTKVGEYLASEEVLNDSQYDEIRELWSLVDSYSYTEENVLIADLEQNNKEKFTLVKDIVNTEILKNKKLKEDFNKSLEEGTRKVSDTMTSNVIEYNTALEKYNKVTVDNLEKVMNEKNDDVYSDLKVLGEDLINKTELLSSQYYLEEDNSKLLAANPLTYSGSTVVPTCNNSNGNYSYNYEGLYVIENGKSYRLFDYKKELTGDEIMQMMDYDVDGDDDILYLMNGTLYLKENLSGESRGTYLNEEPTVIASRNNKFVNNNFIEAVNNFKSYISTDSLITASFSPLQQIYNYRMSYYPIIDRFYNEGNDGYIPEFVRKNIIEGISGIGTINVSKEEQLYNELRDLVYITNIGEIRDVEIEFDDFTNIKNDIDNGNVVSLGNGTYVYAGNASTTLRYVTTGTDDIKAIVIPKNRHLMMKTPINVVGITGAAYVKSGERATLSGGNISQLIGKPLFPGTIIRYIGEENEYRDNNYLDLRYYDDSTLSINFNEVSSLELIDLGNITSSMYTLYSKAKNGFYYAKVNSFKNSVVSSSSEQILLSPQKRPTVSTSEIDLPSLKLPIYQKKEFNLSDYITFDEEISEIKDVYIDFDLSADLNMDGNTKNDNDSVSREDMNIIKNENSIIIELGEFNELVNKNIGINIETIDGIKSLYEVNFEVYTPQPQILNYDGTGLVGNINEDLTDEPINIYRIRGGVVTKLENTEGLDTVMTNEGSYEFGVSEISSGIQIEKNNSVIAQVNESTGKIYVRNPMYSVKVYSSNNALNDKEYPKIILTSGSEDIFYQTLKVSGNKEIKIVNNFENITNNETGLYAKLYNASNYRFDTIPLNTPSNGGSLVIYRQGNVSNEELFVIFRDGRINTLNENYVLEYDSFGDYIMIRLIDKHFNRTVAEVLYKINSEYVVQ